MNWGLFFLGAGLAALCALLVLLFPRKDKYVPSNGSVKITDIESFGMIKELYRE